MRFGSLSCILVPSFKYRVERNFRMSRAYDLLAPYCANSANAADTIPSGKTLDSRGQFDKDVNRSISCRNERVKDTAGAIASPQERRTCLLHHNSRIRLLAACATKLSFRTVPRPSCTEDMEGCDRMAFAMRRLNASQQNR